MKLETSKQRLKSLSLALLAVSLFSGCWWDKNTPIPQPLNCPELNIIKLPDRVWASFDVLGKTEVHDDNRSNILSSIMFKDTDVYLNLKDKGNYSIKNAIMMDMSMLTVIVEYIGDLRTEIELYNNKVISLENNNSSKNMVK